MRVRAVYLMKVALEVVGGSTTESCLWPILLQDLDPFIDLKFIDRFDLWRFTDWFDLFTDKLDLLTELADSVKFGCLTSILLLACLPSSTSRLFPRDSRAMLCPLTSMLACLGAGKAWASPADLAPGWRGLTVWITCTPGGTSSSSRGGPAGPACRAAPP